MNIISKLYYRVHKTIAEHLSVFKKRKNIKRLKNSNFTIISQNCIGGVISHDLGLRFLSPTVNLYMSGPDFITFVQHIKEFQKSKITFVKSESNYPVGYIEHNGQKVYLNFVHYKTPKEAAEKWHDRYTRINYDNIFVIMTDRDGFTLNDLETFYNLPYKKKLFTSKKIHHKDVVYCKEFEGQPFVGDLTEYVSIFGKRGIDGFDYVEWFNSESSV